MFSMHFASSVCKMRLQDWIHSKPNSVLAGEDLGELGRSKYQGNFLTPVGRISYEVSSCIQKAGYTFIDLGYPRHCCDIWLPIIGRIYITAVRLVLLCGSIKWPLWKNVWALVMFEHRCCRRKVFGPMIQSSEKTLNPYRLKWLRHFTHGHRKPVSF